MRGKTVLIYCLMCVVAFSSGLIGGYYYMIKDEPQTITADEKEQEVSVLETETETPEPVSTGKAEEAPAVENGYLLMLDEGGIKVYKLLSDGSAEFMYKKEADTNQLRQEDYASLCKGITVKSESEARGLLEDFLS